MVHVEEIFGEAQAARVFSDFAKKTTSVTIHQTSFYEPLALTDRIRL